MNSKNSNTPSEDSSLHYFPLLYVYSSHADNVIEAHGYSMKFKLTIVSIHLAKVQLVQRFDCGGFLKLQN